MLVVSLAAAGVDEYTDNNNTETRLFNELFGPAAKYDQRARPQHHAVNVSISYVLDSILELVGLFNTSFGEINRFENIFLDKSFHKFQIYTPILTYSRPSLLLVPVTRYNDRDIFVALLYLTS